MRSKWKSEELSSLLETLGKHTNVMEAIKAHNKKWKVKRTYQSLENKLRRESLGTMQNYLKVDLSDKDVELDLIKQLVAKTKGKSKTLTELCDELDLSPKKLKDLFAIAKQRGFNIKSLAEDRIILDTAVQRYGVIHHLEIKPVHKVIRVSGCADIHKGSKVARHDEFNDFVNFAYNEYGVKDNFIAGDITAGINMYRGQNNELVAWSGEEQAEIAMETIPEHKGLTHHMIGGNHDESFMKASGLDVLKVISNNRDDIIHYGYHQALINVNKIMFEIFHPDKAGSYAISYHLQKGIESIPGGMKPDVQFSGHTHQAMFLPGYRNVHAFYAGCFEDQTLYLKRKHILPIIGGWILELGLTKDNQIKTVQPLWVHYFHGTRYVSNPNVGK